MRKILIGLIIGLVVSGSVAYGYRFTKPLRITDYDQKGLVVINDNFEKLWNVINGRINLNVETTAPVASVTEGDIKLYYSGATERIYAYINSAWRYLTFSGGNDRYTWIPAESLRAPAAGSGTFVDHGISGAWEFSDNQEETILFNMKIPDDVDTSQSIYICLGWSSPTVSANCDWEIAYLITALDEATDGSAQQTLQSLKKSSATSDGLVISAFEITTSQYGSGDICIHGSVTRDGNDASDNLGDVAHIHGIALKYTEN